MKWLFNRPVKIHCWGGFGSQLNALALAHRLNDLFSHREIVLVIHEGGRHNAKYELMDFDLSNFNIKLTTDPYQTSYKLKNDYKIKIKGVLKRILVELGFYSTCDSLKDIRRLKPWVMVIRGSYNLFPTESFLNFLISKIRKSQIERQVDLVVHYRLGDLIKIEEKNPIASSVLIELIESIEDKQVIKDIIVLTSDPEIAKSLFEKLNARLAVKIEFYFAKPIEVLSIGMSGKVFIGTNSKMSLWPIWLRTTNNSLNNFLPSSFQEDLTFLNQLNNPRLGIKFY